MIGSIFKNLFRRRVETDLSDQLSSLITEIRSHQVNIERFHTNVEASASHFEHILEPNNFISAEWVNGNLHVKHRH